MTSDKDRLEAIEQRLKNLEELLLWQHERKVLRDRTVKGMSKFKSDTK